MTHSKKISKQNSGICFGNSWKFNWIPIEWQAAINYILNRSRVTTTLVKMSNFGGRDSRARASGTDTFHVSLFKCPGWKFVGKVRSSRTYIWRCMLSWDDVISWWIECSDEDPVPFQGPDIYLHLYCWFVFHRHSNLNLILTVWQEFVTYV